MAKPLLDRGEAIVTPLSFGEGNFRCEAKLLHRFSRILDLALSGLDDRTIDLAGAHGDAGEADFVQAADRVDIATVLAADEDFELRIDGAGIFDEAADHLLDGGMDGDERMTLEEFLVDVERQEAVGVVAGNGECRLGEVVGTEGSEATDGVNVIVIAGDFGAESRDDFTAGDGGCRGFDHRAECVRHCEALFFLNLGGNLDGDFENGLDFGSDDHERDFDFGFRMFAFLNEFGGGVQNGLDLHLGDFGVGDGHTDRAVAEHRVLFLFQAAVVREELVEQGIEQTDGMPHADCVDVFVGAVLFRLRLNTHGLRRYALRAYAPLRPAMRSNATRSSTYAEQLLITRN